MTAHFIYGFHAVLGRLRQNAAAVEEIYLDAARRDARARDLSRLAQEHGVRVIMTDAARLDGMAAGGRHQGVAARVAAAPARVTVEEVLEDLTEPALLLVLDGVQDPRNLGACLRSADAFGAHAVIAPKDRAAGLNAAALKAASGAAVPFIPVTNLARTLRLIKEHGIRVAGTDAQASADLFGAELDGALAVVLGAEGEGMRRLTREHCDLLVRIPMLGAVESLNVSVAAGVCLFEARRRRVDKPGAQE